jgi:hypothetical protein
MLCDFADTGLKLSSNNWLPIPSRVLRHCVSPEVLNHKSSDPEMQGPTAAGRMGLSRAAEPEVQSLLQPHPQFKAERSSTFSYVLPMIFL